ncbi:MAG: FHA domain-containing protein, partial [Pirellulales bacterium]
MEAKLVVVGGKANKSEVKLKLPAMIGRSRDADITVSHASVSRHHCLVYELDGALVVRDNGSLNGTVIDGQRVKEALLKPGQSLTIGPLTFRADYEFDGEFPRLGAASPAASNGEVAARKPRVAAGPSAAGPSGAGPSGAGPSGAGPSGAGPSEPEVDEPLSAEPEHAEQPTPEVEAKAMEPPLPDVSAGEEPASEESAA